MHFLQEVVAWQLFLLFLYEASIALGVHAALSPIPPPIVNYVTPLTAMALGFAIAGTRTWAQYLFTTLKGIPGTTLAGTPKATRTIQGRAWEFSFESLTKDKSRTWSKGTDEDFRDYLRNFFDHPLLPKFWNRSLDKDHENYEKLSTHLERGGSKMEWSPKERSFMLRSFARSVFSASIKLDAAGLQLQHLGEILAELKRRPERSGRRMEPRTYSTKKNT